MAQRDINLNHVWDVNLLDWVRMEQPVIDGGSVTISGSLTVAQGAPASTANRWPVQITDGTDLALVTAAGALLVDASATTQPVSATNLDIRDLTFAADKVDVSGSTGVGVTGPLTDVQLRATPVPVSATDLDIRNLAPATDTVAIGDGSATATIRNLAANDALNVAIVDGSGAQITSFGGGTEYTEGATDASITGTAILMEGAAETLLPVQGTVADGLLVNLGTNNDVVVSATDLDIRDLVFATDKVDVSGSVITASSAATATEEAPSYTEGNAEPFSQDLEGNLRTRISAVVDNTSRSYIDGAIQPLSLSADGRLRVVTVMATTYMELFRDDNMFFDVPELTNDENPWNNVFPLGRVGRN